MVTDFYGVTDTQVFTIVVEPQPLVIDTLVLPPPGTVGLSYSHTLKADGGMPNYDHTWRVSAGSLPNNLNLNTDTGEIWGTPRGGAKTYNFTVEVTDGPVITAQPLSIVISR